MTTENLIERVARLAYKANKPSKAATFAALRTVIDHLAVLERMADQWDMTADDMKAYIQGHDVTPELATLYRQFMPPAPKKPRTVFEWVAMARGKKDNREYLHFVYVTPDRIVASDGHRLHLAPNADGLAPGYYNGAGVRLWGLDHWQYPDFDRVTPKPCTRNRDTIQPVEPPATVRPEKGGKTYTAVSLVHDSFEGKPPVHVNKVYWDTAISLELAGDKDRGINTLLEDPLTAVRLNLPGDRVAVIMPLRD